MSLKLSFFFGAADVAGDDDLAGLGDLAGLDECDLGAGCDREIGGSCAAGCGLAGS